MAHDEKRPQEADLYDVIERWVCRYFRCWETKQNTGPGIGRIDVVGIRDVGGDLSGRSEVIAVEVKAGRQPFVTSAGQAHGYSVMADRCYLADYRTSGAFSPSEMLVAGRLGIGLIAIRPSRRVSEVLTAPPHEPIEELRLQVIEKLGLSMCSLCGTIFRRTDRDGANWSNVARQVERPGALRRAVRDGKGFAWWLRTAADERDTRDRNAYYWRRYLCTDCTSALFRDFSQEQGL